MRLPNGDAAIIPPEKLRGYLLAHSHPIGHFKARFFGSLGFSAEDWRALETQIRSLLTNDAVKKEKTKYGQKYEIRGTITGVNGRQADIVTAWIILENDPNPRFITAYPGGEQ